MSRNRKDVYKRQILIDEARTPLIISGAGTQAADTYKKFARVMPGLKEGVDFDMDEAKRTINATESGLETVSYTHLRHDRLGLGAAGRSRAGRSVRPAQPCLGEEHAANRPLRGIGGLGGGQRGHAPGHGGDGRLLPG